MLRCGKLNLEFYMFKLTHAIDKIKISVDSLTILIEIQDCIKLLKELSLQIRQENKVNLTHMLSQPQTIHIFDFLSRRETYKIGLLTCKLWNSVL